MRVLIADDHPLVREGIRAMLESEPDFEVIGEANNREEAFRLYYLYRPDLVLMDVRMPTMDGLEATQAIKKDCPQTSVLMLTSYENPDYLLEALKAGVTGYVLKEATKGELLSALRRVVSGETPLDEAVATQLLMRLADESKQEKPSDLAPPRKPSEEYSKPPTLEVLTSRETAVLRLLVDGRTNKEIAKTLFTSVNTVKKHVQQIFAKLGVSDRTQAARKAVELVGLHS